MAEREPEAWLAKLSTSAIPVTSTKFAKGLFDKITTTPLERESFQSTLFRCGLYYNLLVSDPSEPGFLFERFALAIAASRCKATASSPQGGVGLFLLTPAVARAYHLVIRSGIDQRRSPHKSMVAAAQYWHDLREFFGDWELAVAASRFGAHGLLVKLELLRKAGIVQPTFLDLLDADLAGPEMESFVAQVEMSALVLQNRPRLNFGEGETWGDPLTELEVPPGTRLSTIARAASSSLERIRIANLDVLNDEIPPDLDGPYTVYVWQHQIRETKARLEELLRTHDDADTCVGAHFHWDRHVFTAEMASACRRNAPSNRGHSGGI